MNGKSLLAYLDSTACIYAVEGEISIREDVLLRLAELVDKGFRFAVSDLTWLECRVKPLRAGDARSLARMEAFLTSCQIERLSLPRAVFDQACAIRADYRFSTADSLHLACAIHADCTLLLTNDRELADFPLLPVNVLLS